MNKIVWRAGKDSENLAVKCSDSIRRDRRLPLCMGEAGLISRVLARKFGEFLTFASLDQESATAPGQATVGGDEISIAGTTSARPRRYSAWSPHPVRHSMSPAISYAAFTATGYDGVYLPMLVLNRIMPDSRRLWTFAASRNPQPLQGRSVTTRRRKRPDTLKEKGAEVEELAQIIGAMNAIPISASTARRRRSAGRTPIMPRF